jgi:plastocyanin
MRTRMNKPALLLSLLALGTLGLVACGGDDDQIAAASETETSNDSAAVRDFEAERRIARARRHELDADNTADHKSCGRFGRYRFAVAEGDVSCRVARRVMRANSIPRTMPGSWSCGGDDSKWVCVNEAGEMIKAYVTCNANRLAHGDRDRSRCPGWIKRSEAQRRHGVGLVAWGADDDDSDASAATTTAPAAGSDGDHRVKLHPAHKSRVFKPDTTAKAGDLTIVWKNRVDAYHNICMEDEQGKPVFKKVVFNGGRERPAQATPRCSKKIKARTIRARAKVKPGEYTYYCSLGRHREAGQEGTLTVK